MMFRFPAVAALLAVMISPSDLVSQTRPTTSTTPATTAAQLAKDPSDVLKGVEGVQVIVATKSAEIDSAALQTRVELKLRQNAIPIGETFDTILILGCVALDKPEQTIPAYTCQLTVNEPVRVRNLLVMGTIWTTPQSVATVGRNKYKASLSETFDELIDQFLNDWYKANPKK